MNPMKINSTCRLAFFVASSCAFPLIALAASPVDLGILPLSCFAVFVVISTVLMSCFAFSGTASFSFCLADSVAMSCSLPLSASGALFTHSSIS